MDKRITDILLLSIAPLILMAYGWYLGQLHQSMVDLAGIIMFFTGAIGLIIGIVAYFVLKPKKWYWDVLLGIGGVVIVFIGIVIYARING